MAFAKKKNSRRKERPSGFGQGINTGVLIKRVLPLAALLILSLMAAVTLRSAFMSLPCFIVDRINVISVEEKFHKAEELRSADFLVKCKGKNIFEINIEKTAHRVREAYPELKNVSVNRVMPDVIEVKVTPRVAVAFVRLEQSSYPIDAESVVLSADAQLTDRLPLIDGVDSPKVRPGQKIKSKQVKSVLVLLKKIQAVETLRKYYSVARVEIINSQSIYLYLNNGIEVRMGQGDITEKLKKLETILKDQNVNKNNVRYIDLRFKDAVIGLGPR